MASNDADEFDWGDDDEDDDADGTCPTCGAGPDQLCDWDCVERGDELDDIERDNPLI
jgi:hypothetical protein